MNILWFKLPIYFILWHKVLQIAKTRRELKESKTLDSEDEAKLTAFMAAYGCVFVLLLLS